MRHFGSFIGAAIAGIYVFSIWGKLVGAYGLMGGWLAAMVTIGVAAIMNHVCGVIYNEEGGAWVDMGLGIGVAGTAMGVFSGSPLVNALPTLGLVAIGAILGGVAAGMVNDAINAKDEKVQPEVQREVLEKTA